MRIFPLCAVAQAISEFRDGSLSVSLRGIALAALLGVVAPAAHATVSLTSGVTPGPDNVLFNCGTCVTGPSNPVVGSVDGFLVDFTTAGGAGVGSTSGLLQVNNANGGQASVSDSTKNGLIFNISYEMETAFYLRTVFKVTPDPTNTDGTFDITVTTTSGTTYHFDNTLLSGPNGGFFTLAEDNLDLATATEFIDKVTFDADVGSGTDNTFNGFTDIRQIRIGLICDANGVCVDNEVPEPATLALLGPAVLGIGYFARRRRK
jgi:hypothetical protein